MPWGKYLQQLIAQAPGRLQTARGQSLLRRVIAMLLQLRPGVAVAVVAGLPITVLQGEVPAVA